MKKLAAMLIVFTAISIAAVGCDLFGGGDTLILPSSRSYQGHESDLDMDVFIYANPGAIGTRLDDCQTCHTGGDVDYGGGGGGDIESLNSCSYCHLLEFPDPEIVSGAPATWADTLNPYGLDYMNAGRNEDAIRQIRNQDSDNDGHGNGAEIDDLRYPGDPDSMPGQQTAPIFTFTQADIYAIASHTQLILMNSHKQSYDTYAIYKGVKVIDLLHAANADLANATGITVIAPDGFAKDFTMDEIENQYPDGLWFPNLDPGGFIDPDMGFVEYPLEEIWPGGLVEGGAIPNEMWMLIAYIRDELEMDASVLDPSSGKINGEGPYRLIVPQADPGGPDRGSRHPSTYNDGWDYDDSKDHNAGLCVRGAVAIRINPMPGGYEEFDWKNGGWALINDGVIILYGSGVTGN